MDHIPLPFCQLTNKLNGEWKTNLEIGFEVGMDKGSRDQNMVRREQRKKFSNRVEVMRVEGVVRVFILSQGKTSVIPCCDVPWQRRSMGPRLPQWGADSNYLSLLWQAAAGG